MDGSDHDGNDGLATDEALQRHAAAHEKVSDCPLLSGAKITLLPGGAETLTAIFAALESAQSYICMEYYEFEDVHWEGCSLIDLLEEKLGQGVRLALSYDAAGCSDTPGAVFDRLRKAGARVLEFRPLSPTKKRFNPLRVNDRDHRKILVVDGRVAFLGGVNLTTVYQNPRSAGTPSDANKAFWYDAAARFEGPPVPAAHKLFVNNWRRQGGDELPLPDPDPGPDQADADAGDGEIVRVDGSAPRERRQLYFESLKAALGAARSHVLLATGYFVPTRTQWKLLAEAAARGVSVDLILAGYSDLPSCTHAARALYGKMLKSGVRIHEMHDGMLHAKVATIDGAWTAIGSSNLDRRSFVYNNEVDAIVLGRPTAKAVEAMLRDWMSRAKPISLEEWRSRSVHEHVGEGIARLWSSLM